MRHWGIAGGVFCVATPKHESETCEKSSEAVELLLCPKTVKQTDVTVLQIMI
jgi:hypothetical protein